MELPFWSDKERLLVAWPLGITVNFKYIVRKLGWLKSKARSLSAEQEGQSEPARHSREERLRKQIEASKYEEMK